MRSVYAVIALNQRSQIHLQNMLVLLISKNIRNFAIETESSEPVVSACLIRYNTLKEKASNMMIKTNCLKDYKIEYLGLSMDDM